MEEDMEEPLESVDLNEKADVDTNEVEAEATAEVPLADDEHQPMLSPDGPQDKHNAVYWILLLHGIGTLIAWNMFITIAPSYFVEYKMKETVEDDNGTLTKVDSRFSNNFFNYLTFCSQLPNLLLNALNILVEIKGGLKRKVLISLSIVFIISCITTMFTKIDTSSAVPFFFFFTMFTVIVLNAANGVYQNSLYGVAAAFPGRYTGAVVLGNNICGTFVSIVGVFAIGVFSDVSTAALVFFIVALLTLVMCFVSFTSLPKFEFYNWYMTKHEEEKKKAKDTKEENKMQLYLETFKQCWPMCLSIFLIFFVSLTLFPATMADVKQSSSGTNTTSMLSDQMFTNVTTFLLFNFFAMAGSFVAGYFQWPSAKVILYPVALRVLLIPIMLFCNYQPRGDPRTWPVLISNDYVYIFIAIIMSFTSGYWSSCVMMYAPTLVEPSKAPVAGMMAAFFLIFGIFVGCTFAFATKAMVQL